MHLTEDEIALFSAFVLMSAGKKLKFAPHLFGRGHFYLESFSNDNVKDYQTVWKIILLSVSLTQFYFNKQIGTMSLEVIFLG